MTRSTYEKRDAKFRAAPRVNEWIGDLGSLDLSLSQSARQLQKQRKDDATDQIIWGAEAIAPYLGRTTKGAFGALESGKVPGAKKIAGRWGLSLKVFLASFEGAS